MRKQLTEGSLRKTSHNYASARRLRRKMTLPEGLVWRELKARKTGLKFRRQHPVGRYVLDFYCAAANLGIEIDGKAHDMGDNPSSDAVRDRWLSDQGIAIMRIPATEVLKDPVHACEAIVAACRERV